MTSLKFKILVADLSQYDIIVIIEVCIIIILIVIVKGCIIHDHSCMVTLKKFDDCAESHGHNSRRWRQRFLSPCS